MSWRAASREEIYRYYTAEFPSALDQLPAFLTATGPKQFAISLDESHPIREQDAPPRDFIRRDTWQTSRDGDRLGQNFDTFDSVVRFFQHPARNDPLQGSKYALADPELLKKSEPVAHAVYYALDNWERWWILLIDIDAKDIASRRAETELTSDVKTESELLERAGILGEAPSGYPYSYHDITRALEYGFEVRDFFEDRLSATETMVVYTGQGCHVYLLDADLAHHYDSKSREVINDLLLARDIPIDPVVTADRRRVARFPYSLHTDVSRVAQPIESPAFDFKNQAKPAYLTNE